MAEESQEPQSKKTFSFAEEQIIYLMNRTLKFKFLPTAMCLGKKWTSEQIKDHFLEDMADNQTTKFLQS